MLILRLPAWYKQASNTVSAVQVYVYKLPELPGATRGYSVTDQPFMPPSDSKSPFFGSGGLAATSAGDYVYVAAPVAPQPTSTLAALYGNSSVFIYKVCPHENPPLPT